MNTYTQLYWLTRLDAIQGLCIGLVVFTTIILLFYFIWRFVEGEYIDEGLEAKTKFIPRWFIPVLIIATLGLTFIPTRNEVIFIVAGGKTIDYVQQDTSLNKIPGQTTAIISQFLENQIEEMTKSEKK